MANRIMPLVRKYLGLPQSKRSRSSLPWLGGTSTAADVNVTPERALQVATVYSSVRLLSESVASLPVTVHRRRDNRNEFVSDADPVVALIVDQPNPDIDAGELWRTVMGWMLLRGNAYVWVERNGAGTPIGLWPIAPTSVAVKRSPLGRLVYAITLSNDEYIPGFTPGTTSNKPADDVLHYRAFGLGMEGLSPIGMARQQIGISFATTQYIGGFFARDASPGGVVSVAGELTDQQYERLTEQWKGLHEGFRNSHRLAVMEGGAKWEKTNLSPGDAQFLDVYKLTRSEIAAIFGVPPHKIGDLEHATFSNIEHQSIEFVTDSLVPWITRLERVTRQLFTDKSMRVKWNVNGLLRGDTAARYAGYAIGRQWGFLSGNDIRKLEDQEPVDGLDEYLVPLNMLPAGQTPVQRTARARARLAQRSAVVPSEESPGWATRLADLLGDYFEQQREQVVEDIGAARSLRSLSDVDRDAWDELLADILVSPFTGIASDFGKAEAEKLGGSFSAVKITNWVKAAALRSARNVNETTFSQIDAALADMGEGDTPALAANRVFDEASSLRSDVVAVALVNSIGQFGRHEGASQSGAGEKTWIVTSSNPRSSHSAMNGETVPIDQTFSNGCMWPGDPSGGADEVAGCMCSVEFTVGS